MFGWSLALILAAIISALLVFGGFTRGASEAAPSLYFAFAAFLVASVIWGLAPPKRPRPHS